MYRGSLVNIRLQSLNDMGKLAEFKCKQRYIETHSYDLPVFSYKEGLEKEFKERMEKHDHDALHMAIETVDGKVIGAIGIDWTFWKNGLTYMYSYIGDEEYLEGGYHDEALKLFLEFLFIEGNARKVKTNIQSNNQERLAVYQANGFNINVHYKEDVLCHGKYIDTFELSIFKDDYMKNYNR